MIHHAFNSVLFSIGAEAGGLTILCQMIVHLLLKIIYENGVTELMGLEGDCSRELSLDRFLCFKLFTFDLIYWGKF